MSEASGTERPPVVRMPSEHDELDTTITTVVTQVEEQELERGSLAERRAAMRDKRRARLLAASLFALVGVAAWNVQVWNRPIQDDVLEADDLQLRLQLAVVADEIDEFQTRRGRLPESLAELGVDGGMFRYTADAEGYYLAILGTGGTVEYVSEEDPRALLADWNGGVGTGGGR
jgi:hypothetical protein